MALVKLVRVDAAQVTRGVLVLPTSTTFDATGIRDGQLIQFNGRTTDGDGCGGLFMYKASSTASVDGGVVIAPLVGTGRLHRTIQTSNSESQASESYNVRWWGALGDAAHDDTAAILAAYNYAKNTALFYSLVFPAGRYVTLSQFLFTDVFNATFIMQAATFIGASTGANNSQDALFQIQNAVNLSIVGSCTFTTKPESGPTTGNPNAYQRGFWAVAKPGGTLNPTAGICAFCVFDNFTTTKIGNGVSVGEIGNDAQTSEMVFNNLKTPFTVQPFYAGGSQTLVSLNGCTLAANPVSDIIANNNTIIQDGGAITMVGGNLEFHSSTTSNTILMRPASSSLYGNPYGQITISGAAIEVKSPLLAITNQFGFASPSSYHSRFALSNCTGGYAGDVPPDASFISVFDGTYAGILAIPDGNAFYATQGVSTRTGWNVQLSGNNKVRCIVGKSVFDTSTGFLGYPHGIAGGILLHPEMLGTSAYVTAQSIPANAQTTVVWANNPVDNERTGRYQYMLNTSTGAITLPDAGIRRVRIEAAVVCGNGAGNLLFMRNGSLYAYGSFAQGVGTLNVTIPDPTLGDVYSVRVLSAVAGTLDNLSKLNVYLET